MLNQMNAVILRGATPADQIHLEKTPIPEVRPGWILVEVKAFGMNHSEQILRLSEIDANYINKPLVPGIECAGEVVDPSDSKFKKGQKVISLMGGMGRSFWGSYAEYILLPERQVFSVESNLSWDRLAAVPETYFTAWGSLFQSLQLQAKDTLLIRGATSALGYASIQLAKALGCEVIASTHRDEKLPLLSEADYPIVDEGKLEGKVSGITKALELVGPKTLRDTLKAVETGAIVCNTGVLGGVYTINDFDPIKEIPNGVYLTGFFSNYPSQKIIDDIFNFLEYHSLKPCIGESFKFSEIQSACIAMDEGKVNGKIVVTM